MASRYRTNLVLKLFPSVPRGMFGKGKLGQRMTELLERRVFYREFEISPARAGFVAAVIVGLCAWSVLALALAFHALFRAESMRQDLTARQENLADERLALNESRRDYYLLLSRLTPMNEKVDQLAEFSRKLATVAGVDGLAEQLGSTAAERRLDMHLSEDEVAELDRRFARLGTFVENQEFELSRTPSISPIRDSFTPTDRFGYRINRFLTEPSSHGGDGRQFHQALDLAATIGTAIHATADGTVHFAGSIPATQDAGASLYGNFVIIDHGNGIRTVYAHCAKLAVETGQEVKRGDVIAWVGSTGRSTGPHLHYEVVVNGRPTDPELFVLDVALPEKRVRVDFDAPSLLVQQVDRLLGGAR